MESQPTTTVTAPTALATPPSAEDDSSSYCCCKKYPIQQGVFISGSIHLGILCFYMVTKFFNADFFGFFRGDFFGFMFDVVWIFAIILLLFSIRLENRLLVLIYLGVSALFVILSMMANIVVLAFWAIVLGVGSSHLFWDAIRLVVVSSINLVVDMIICFLLLVAVRYQSYLQKKQRRIFIQAGPPPGYYPIQTPGTPGEGQTAQQTFYYTQPPPYFNIAQAQHPEDPNMGPPVAQNQMPPQPQQAFGQIPGQPMGGLPGQQPFVQYAVPHGQGGYVVYYAAPNGGGYPIGMGQPMTVAHGTSAGGEGVHQVETTIPPVEEPPPNYEPPASAPYPQQQPQPTAVRPSALPPLNPNYNR